MPQVPGPHGPIPFSRDALGYPSIRAGSLLEANYALGYLHATDRLTQVTLLSLAARGELMSVLGNVPFARLIDRSIRMLGGRSELDRQIDLLDSETFRFLEVYCEGFNLGAKHRGRPLVLRMLDAPAAEYTPAMIAAAFRFIAYFGLTSTQLSAELLLGELCARGASPRMLERLVGEGIRGLDLEAARSLVIPHDFGFFGTALAGSPLVGSNAFAVAGERSESGGALLMGEFHMEVGRFPPLLYAVHIDLPDAQYLSGVTVPGLAWLAAGRTAHVGFSYTFAHADNVDVLIEEVKDGAYRVADTTRPFRKRRELVRVRGRSSEVWEFYDNDYGTLVGDARGEARRACVRVSGLSEIHRALSATRRITACRTVEDLVELHRDVRILALEAILVDDSGAIASVVTGQIDQRPGDWSGVIPRRGWDVTDRPPAPLAEELRPVLVRPEIGVVASANQGGQGPNRALWCALPEPRYRFDRITERLAAVQRHDLASMIDISYDDFDGCAERLMRVWRPLLPDHPLADELAAWAADQRDRRWAGLFHQLHEETYLELLAEDIGDSAARRFTNLAALTFFQHHVDDVLALSKPHLLDANGLRALLARSFPRAIARYETYSVPVKLRFRHLLTRGRSPALLGFDSPRVELPGTPTSPFQARVCEAAGEKLVYAPAFHIAFDMGERGAYYNLPGGASERRLGPGYGLGVSQWLSGTFLPLGHSRPSLVRPLNPRRSSR